MSDVIMFLQVHMYRVHFSITSMNLLKRNEIFLIEVISHSYELKENEQ